MAVIQISRIQIRRGQASDQGLPQLSSGEMGWAIDTQQLFIGNGSVSEGAPAVGNTEIITESRMFELLTGSESFTATNYTYRGHNPNVILQDSVTRTIQHKLDDNVTSYDYGASDSSDATQYIQKALDELYLNPSTKTKPSSRVPFRIPAGTYFITSPIYVPPYANIIGDGIDKTILVSINSTNTTIFETIDGTSTKNSRVRGLDILSSSQPRNINISGLTLSHTSTNHVTTSTPLLIMSGMADSSIRDVKFTGIYSHGAATSSTHAAIELFGGLTTQCYIENCYVENFCYPIISNYDATDIYIKDNVFKDLYQGITFATSLIDEVPQKYGPRRVSIKDNKFINIERQAIYAGYNTGYNNQICSEDNTYIAVGNGTTIGGTVNGDDKPETSIISFFSAGNSSINDNFERLWYAQIDGINKKQKPVVEGTAQVQIKFTDRRPLEVSGDPITLVRIPFATTVTSVTMAYTIDKDPVLHRKGVVSVVGGLAGLTIRDEYAVAGDGSTDDLVFNATFLDSEYIGIVDTLAVQYTNPVSTGTCIFNVLYYT
jgi:hypothetical protein